MEDRNNEIYNFLFDVMNGKIKDTVLTKEKDENNNPITTEVPVSVNVRMKAAELLFKNVSDNGSNKDVLPVVICEDL